VTIEMLLGLVKVGIAASTEQAKPSRTQVASVGIVPSARAASRYSGSKPSMQITATGRSGTR